MRLCIYTYLHSCLKSSIMMYTHVILQAIPHVVAWGGRESNMSSWSLLASLWRQEETDMGVPRGDLGTLAGQTTLQVLHTLSVYATLSPHLSLISQPTIPLFSGTDRNPLVGHEQEACGVPPIPTHQPSASIIDITENMRAKIYILCCKMGEC